MNATSEIPVLQVPNKFSAHEKQRLAALEATDLLDSSSELAFDRLTEFAATALKVPVALISLVGEDRQFFKSQCGLPTQTARARQTPLSESFCRHVVASGEPLVVEDARLHGALRTNPAVRTLPVVAYAGVPLVDPHGYCLGSLCAIDHKPRQWLPNDIELLKGLAAQTMTEIELRAKTKHVGAQLAAARRDESERQRIIRLTVHDLRTPITSLMLCLDMLPEFAPLSPDQYNFLSLCKRSGQALRELVDDLLDYEVVGHRGSHALTISTGDPQALANLALDQVTGLAKGKKLRLQRTIPADLPLFEGDIHKLSRVLVNLLGNAIKFTCPGGEVRLTVAQSEDKDQLLFSVSDTGIGFHRTEKETIFDEGVSLDKKASTSQSTGLGLTFCKRIVEAHGGQILVESTPGKGSVFTVVLPVSAGFDAA